MMKKNNYLLLLLIAFFLFQSCNISESPVSSENELKDNNFSPMITVEPGDPENDPFGDNSIVLTAPDGNTIDLEIDDIELEDGTMLSDVLQGMIDDAWSFAEGKGRFPERLARVRFLVRARIYLWRLYRSGVITREQYREIWNALRNADLF